MPGTDPVYYWDACLFTAWINDETRPSGEMDGVREVIERSKRHEVKIITSVLTITEVLECKLPVGMPKLFNNFMKRINRIAFDAKIAEMAHDLRNHYSATPEKFGNKVLATPDAIHLATALIYRADEFHTFDGGKKNGKHLGLLELDGDVGGHRLKICKPAARNPGLDLRPMPNNRKGS